MHDPQKSRPTVRLVYGVCPLIDLRVRVNSPVSILRKSVSGRHRTVRVADGPMTARCRFRRMLAGLGFRRLFLDENNEVYSLYNTLTGP